jgi:iron complex outermembrane receptor protein
LSALLSLACAAQAAEQPSTEELKKLSVEELMDIQVTSVSKTSQSLGDAAAAVYVITHEDIVRSGAMSIPEILRLAPNLEVFQLSPSNYIITARGFNGNSADQSFSNKLLVLIDGRSVYTPLYSGVYWDVQDLPLEDIERVEVISGPGATLWGANAVNGVINITTRQTADTQGALTSVSFGNLEKNASAELGGALSADTTFRAYAKGFERKALDTPAGTSAEDSWSKGQAGFRGDWNGATDTLTLQGDTYLGHEEQPGTPDQKLFGGNVLARWQHSLANGSLQLQAYYDDTQRETPGNGGFVLHTYDIELQQVIGLGSSNEFIWGAGERVSRYGITNTEFLLFLPPDRTLDLTNVFAQDSISLPARLKLVVGLKLEKDPYTGTQPLPDVRLSWKISDTALLWSAVSRAIRSATPFDRDVAEYLGKTLFLVGGQDFQPEKLTAYEAGFRSHPGSALSLSISSFYNVYNDLRSVELTPGTVIPLYWGNSMEGKTYGAELWGNYQAADSWQLAFGYTEQRERLRFKPSGSGVLGVSQAGNDPHRQAQLRSSIDLTTALTWNAALRYMGSLPNPSVRAYAELNSRLGWRVSRHWEMALSGANLLHARHEEYTVPPSDAISRSVLLTAEARL